MAYGKYKLIRTLGKPRGRRADDVKIDIWKIKRN
jgi:hypothetical protein